MCSPSGAASTLGEDRRACRCGVIAPVAASTSASWLRRVVVEEVLVVLARERVARLVGAALAVLAVGLLDARPVRRDRRRRAAARRCPARASRAASSGRASTAASCRASGSAARRRGGCIAPVAASPIQSSTASLRGVAEREALAVGGPRDAVGAAARRQRHRRLAARRRRRRARSVCAHGAMP